MSLRKNKTTANIGLAIWRLTEFLSAIVLCRKLGIFINFSAKIPPHRQAEKR